MRVNRRTEIRGDRVTLIYTYTYIHSTTQVITYSVVSETHTLTYSNALVQLVSVTSP